MLPPAPKKRVQMPSFVPPKAPDTKAIEQAQLKNVEEIEKAKGGGEEAKALRNAHIDEMLQALENWGEETMAAKDPILPPPPEEKIQSIRPAAPAAPNVPELTEEEVEKLPNFSKYDPEATARHLRHLENLRLLQENSLYYHQPAPPSQSNIEGGEFEDEEDPDEVETPAPGGDRPTVASFHKLYLKYAADTIPEFFGRTFDQEQFGPTGIEEHLDTIPVPRKEDEETMDTLPPLPQDEEILQMNWKQLPAPTIYQPTEDEMQKWDEWYATRKKAPTSSGSKEKKAESLLALCNHYYKLATKL